MTTPIRPKRGITDIKRLRTEITDMTISLKTLKLFIKAMKEENILAFKRKRH